VVRGPWAVVCVLWAVVCVLWAVVCVLWAVDGRPWAVICFVVTVQSGPRQPAKAGCVAVAAA